MFDRSKSILLVEDNHDHAELVYRSLEENEITTPMKRVADGEEALEYLQKQGEYSESTHLDPDLILLDLRLPKMDGLEVLRWLKNSEEFQNIPIVILSSSDADDDRCASYKLRANAYVVKPIDFLELMELTRSLDSFWLNWNTSA
ncbi:response regulator [bacterium]|jgi:CheY-like chemotaxis protein|nr:response regulator [bacterium]